MRILRYPGDGSLSLPVLQALHHPVTGRACPPLVPIPWLQSVAGCYALRRIPRLPLVLAVLMTAGISRPGPGPAPARTRHE